MASYSYNRSWIKYYIPEISTDAATPGVTGEGGRTDIEKAITKSETDWNLIFVIVGIIAILYLFK